MSPAAPLYEEERAPPVGASEGNEKPAVPRRIRRLRGRSRTARLAEVVPRSLREAGIDLEGCHPTARSDDLCEDRAVVAGPCAYMDHAVAAREAQLVEQARPVGSVVRC